MGRTWSRQTRVNQHHERPVSVHSHQQLGRVEGAEAEEGNKLTGDTDDSSGALLGNAEEVVEEGPPPPPEGHCIQNAEMANLPGPPGRVLEKESSVANDFP